MKRQSIKFSIAIVTYNSESVIERLLKSIISQDYNNYEIVCVDGASTDDTVIRTKPFLRNEDIIVVEPDKGVYDAMNKTLRYAKGDFLIFLGSDDYFYSSHVLSDVAKEIEKNGFDLNSIYYGGAYFESYHRIINKKFNNWSWVRGTICHQSIFYPRCIYSKYNYNLQYRINADYAYNLKLWSIANFIHIDVVISYFSSTGLSGNNIDIPFRKDLPKMLLTYCGVFPYVYKQIRMFAGLLFKGRKY